MDFYIRLNKDIINIINNYCDYSQENLFKIYNKNKDKHKNLIELDAGYLIKALQLGFSGFYVYSKYDHYIIKLKNVFKNYDKVRIYRGSSELIFISLDSIGGTLCCIERLIN